MEYCHVIISLYVITTYSSCKLMFFYFIHTPRGLLDWESCGRCALYFGCYDVELPCNSITLYIIHEQIFSDKTYCHGNKKNIRFAIASRLGIACRTLEVALDHRLLAAVIGCV